MRIVVSEVDGHWSSALPSSIVEITNISKRGEKTRSKTKTQSQNIKEVWADVMP